MRFACITNECAHLQVESLAKPQLRFKVDVNAVENHLTGAAIITDEFCVVVVEGGVNAMFLWAFCAASLRKPFHHSASALHKWLRRNHLAGAAVITDEFCVVAVNDGARVSPQVLKEVGICCKSLDQALSCCTYTSRCEGPTVFGHQT